MTTRKTSRPAQSTKTPAKKSSTAAKSLTGKAKVLPPQLSFQARNFAVYTDQVREPSGYVATRNVIRHHGSVVVLAVDDANPRDPSVLMVRQYRHAAGQF